MKLNRAALGVLLGLLAPYGATEHKLSNSLPLESRTNTGLKYLYFKNVQCGEDGHWHIDIINRGIIQSSIEYIFWLEDVEGDPLNGHSSSVHINAKSRQRAHLPFPCETAFTSLRYHFQLSP